MRKRNTWHPPTMREMNGCSILATPLGHPVQSDDAFSQRQTCCYCCCLNSQQREICSSPAWDNDDHDLDYGDESQLSWRCFLITSKVPQARVRHKCVVHDRMHGGIADLGVQMSLCTMRISAAATQWTPLIGATWSQGDSVNMEC